MLSCIVAHVVRANVMFNIDSSGRIEKPVPRDHLLLRPSINGLVTGGNTKLCCQGFILALFQSTNGSFTIKFPQV